MRRKGTLAVAAALGACLFGSLPAAHATPSSSQTAIVSLGDSYISGEAGRWQGNSNYQLGSRNGTDRAWVSTWWGGYYDTSRTYLEGTDDDGCHRSDVAEIRSASISVNAKINLACSGATTANIFRSSNGGQSQNGEAPQDDRLASVANQYNVKLVVLSIGGNDLGFADIITTCATDWTTSPSWAPNYCYDDQQAAVNSRMPGAMASVGRAIDDIRATMSSQGYSPSQYRLVLQSYPSPVPRASENRYSETGWSRLDTGGCPFWNRDLNWARDTLVGQISSNLKAVAASRGAQFLDLRDMLQGREVCATASSLVGSGGPSPTRSEWTRFLVSGVLQGDLQESFHPNAYAQRGLGSCLAQVYAQPASTNWSCRNTAGASYTSMYITPSS